MHQYNFSIHGKQDIKYNTSQKNKMKCAFREELTTALVLETLLSSWLPIQGVQHRLVFLVKFFIFLKLLFSFVVAMSDLVHDVQAMHCLF